MAMPNPGKIKTNAWKFYKHDDGGWRWKHRGADNELIAFAPSSFSSHTEAIEDARKHGFTEDQKHLIRDL
jgi:hypothetical protein